MLLGALLDGFSEGLGLAGTLGWEAVSIVDITDDSRSVMPGSLFIARRGVREDAKRFVPDAVRSGAAAVLAQRSDGFDAASVSVPVVLVDDAQRAAALIAERFYRDPSRSLRVVGVTGTNGKTSVTGLIHQILNSAGIRCGLIGTVITDDGRCVGESSQTTPGAIELSQTLASMVESGCQAAAVEVSSHALHQGRTQAIHFAAGVFTNLTGDHQDYHGDMASYAAAKAKLFAMLPSDGVAVVNAMDPAHTLMVSDCVARGVRVVETGFHGTVAGDHAATAEVTGHSVNGMELVLRGRWGVMEVSLPLFGEHNAMNALQAAVVADALGVERDAIAASLGSVRPARGRLERVNAGDASGPMVLIDYAHTDDALRHALRAMQPIAAARSGKLVVVFGCGGDRDATKRPRMGAAASELADSVIVTSDNPRTEDPSAIIAAVLSGISQADRAKVCVHADRRTAIERAVLDADDADVVVIAGKGHEREQILPDGQGSVYKIHFDDAEEAERALAHRHEAARHGERA